VALTLRGYAPGIRRSRMKVIRLRPADVFSLLGGSAVLVLCIVL